jgi:hypothetical protein
MGSNAGCGPHKFFRITLLSGDVEQITKCIQDMEREQSRIESEVASVVYYMNGGLDYTHAYNLSLHQLKTLGETITSHYEKQEQAIKNSHKRS